MGAKPIQTPHSVTAFWRKFIDPLPTVRNASWLGVELCPSLYWGFVCLELSHGLCELICVVALLHLENTVFLDFPHHLWLLQSF